MSYTKQNWKTGDTITAEKLNYIENGIEAAAESGGDVSPEAISTAVNDWLDDHPEATTTVADGSITNAKLAVDVSDRLSGLDGLVEEYELELGNITIATNGWTYANSNKRVRTKQGTTIHLSAGSTISLASGYRMYIGWKKSDNSYGLQGWVTDEFMCPVDADYILLMTNSPEVVVSDIDAFRDALTITESSALKFTAVEETVKTGTSIEYWSKFLPGLGLNTTTSKYTESGNTRLNIASPIAFTEQMYLYTLDDIYAAYQTRNNDDTINSDSGWKQGVIPLPVNTPFTVSLKKGSAGTDRLTPEDVIEKTAFFKLDLKNPLVIQGFKNQLNNVVHTSNIRGVAHRGYNDIAPENTMPAFRMAHKFGFKWLETDIRKTSDGEFVLLHDASINATARNADGSAISETVNISSITYEQALEYDFGIAKSAEYAGTTIPKLSELLSFCKGVGMNAYLELKEAFSQVDVNKIVEIVAKYNMQDRVIYMSSDATIMGYISQAYPKASLIYLPTALPSTSDAVTFIESIKNDVNEVGVALNRTWSSSSLIEALNKKNVPVDFYTIDSYVYVGTLPDSVRGFITNRLFWLEKSQLDIIDGETGAPLI